MRAVGRKVVHEDVRESRANQHPYDEIREQRIELLLRQHADSSANSRQHQLVPDEVAHQVHDTVPTQMKWSDRDDIRRDLRVRDRHSHLRQQVCGYRYSQASPTQQLSIHGNDHRAQRHQDRAHRGIENDPPKREHASC